MRHDDTVGFEVLRALRRILRRVSLHSRELARHTGLTLPQLISLKAIAESADKEVTIGSISSRVSLSSATVSRIIDRLVSKDLVERYRSESDRRKVLLRLTEHGAERYHALPAPLDERFLERLKDISERERLSLLAALDRIVQLMDAEAEDAAPILVEGVEVEDE
ncbi:MAG: MarR family transcriptional regulator [Acidobacteriota bacterium]|nr:MarR family transcriptional regulator [Acidobacteriota bacterium]